MTNVLSTYSSCKIQRMMYVVWGSQESQVPPAYQVKGSTKWLIWGGMTGRGLTNLHFILQGQTVTADYYISQIMEKEVKPLHNRRSTTKTLVKRKLLRLNQKMTPVQDGAPDHAAKSTQNWCKRNLPNFIHIAKENLETTCEIQYIDNKND